MTLQRGYGLLERDHRLVGEVDRMRENRSYRQAHAAVSLSDLHVGAADLLEGRSWWREFG